MGTVGVATSLQDAALTGKDDTPHAWPRAWVAWYTVGLLSLANGLSFVVRTILSLLVDPVKADLGVSDTAISLLHGFSFALIFAIIGLPMALWADRGNRRNIIALCILIWSVMTAVCGLARSYTVLLIGRLGAGAGEGGFGPASQSMLADLFPREKLPLAMGLYSLGIYAGSGAALMLGGMVAQWAAETPQIILPVLGSVRGWQVSFYLTGIPGVILALLLMTIPEPQRHETAGVITSDVPVTLVDVAKQFGKHRVAYIGLIFGFSLHVLVGFGAASWTPALLGRHFGIAPIDIGLFYGAIFLVCGTIGALTGGTIGNHLLARGIVRANAWILFWAYGIEVFFGIGYAFATTPAIVWTCIAGMNLFSAAAFGAGVATLNEITPNRMRAQMGAAFLFAINLIGAGVGPTVVALLSDRLFTGTFALANAISLTALLAGLPAIILTGLAVRHYPR